MTLLLLLLSLQIAPELRQHVDAGLKAKAAGDWVTAIREFQQVVALAPDLAPAHMNLGSAYYENKDLAAAIAPLRTALKLNPDLPGAHGLLGAALLSQGYARESIPHLERGQNKDLLGVALLDAGRNREAVDALERALQVRPNDPDLLYYLGKAHAQLAAEVLGRIESQHPQSARAYIVMAEARAAMGNVPEAEKLFRAALVQRPDLRGVHFAIGELWLTSADYAQAEPEFREECRLAPGSASAAYKLGFTLLNLGRTAEAVDQLTRANTLQPGMPETLLALGKALHSAGEVEAARSRLEELVSIEATGPLAEQAYYLLAQIYRKLGRGEDANKALKQFQELRKSRR